MSIRPSENEDHIKQLFLNGLTSVQIAKLYKCDLGSIIYILKKHSLWHTSQPSPWTGVGMQKPTTFDPLTEMLE